MPPQNTQSNMTPEEAKASMGIATHLQDQLMPTDPTSPANEPGDQKNPESKVNVKTEISGLETRLMDEIQTLREEMKTQGDGKKELCEGCTAKDIWNCALATLKRKLEGGE